MIMIIIMIIIIIIVIIVTKLNFPVTQETIFLSRDQLRSSPRKKRKLKMGTQ